MPVQSRPIREEHESPDLEALNWLIALAAAGAPREEIIRHLSDRQNAKSLIRVIKSLTGPPESTPSALSTRGDASGGRVKRERSNSPPVLFRNDHASSSRVPRGELIDDLIPSSGRSSGGPSNPRDPSDRFGRRTGTPITAPGPSAHADPLRGRPARPSHVE